MQLRGTLSLLVAIVSVISFGVARCTQTETNVQTPQPNKVQSIQCQLDAPYLPTPQEVVEEILKLADVKGDDVLYDLGSGDGHIVGFLKSFPSARTTL